MNMEATTHGEQRVKAPPVFDRVLVGVDGSPASHEAAWQAAKLLEPDGELTLLAAYDIAPAIVGGTGAAVPAYFDDELQRAAAEKAVAGAAEELAPQRTAETRVARGCSWDALMDEAKRSGATLIVVGSHGTGRARGIVMGSTATELVHKAPCSVLLSRSDGEGFPRRIVVGVDGSGESAAAYAVARELAERTGAELWPVVAHGGKEVDRRLVDAIVGSRREDLQDHPVGALVAAAADADLVVIGSRGLHGVRALGSVSERVAHKARASVLVVRTTPEPARA